MSETTVSEKAGYRDLLSAVVHREVVNWIRYPVNAFGVVVGQLMVFALLFFGGRAVGGAALANSIEGLVVGYFLWSLAGQSYQGVVTIVTNEASWGTLERHFLSPFGFERVLLVKSFARVLRAFAVSVSVLAVMLLVTSSWLALNLVTVLPLLALTILSVLGVGFAMSGLAVLYKRIGSITSFFQFVLIGLVSAPALDIVWVRALPVVQGSAMLQQAMGDGTHLWEFDPASLMILVAVAIGYFGIGFLGFRVAQRRARDLGVLGDY